MLASAPTSESTAVSVIVTSRTFSVGCTRLNESKALSRVSEPPYMFSAITETSPSAEKIRMIVAEAVEHLVAGSAAARRSRCRRRPCPAQAASAAPMHMIQTAPSAEPPYVQ